MAELSLWTSEEAIKATNGWVGGAWHVNGVSIDSRTISDGDLFIALKGPNHDGHDHVVQALAGGGAAAIVSKVPENLAQHSAILKVENTMIALQALAKFARARANAKIIAVTGSVGKTGTKEALKSALMSTESCHASSGSLNNQWGVPLSMARMPRDVNFGIFELAMNHAGEIRTLTKQVRPHVAIVTTIAPAHLKFLGNLKAIAAAKAEIFEGLVYGGIAILNYDNQYFDFLASKARDYGAEVISFGMSELADVHAEKYFLTGDFICVRARIRGRQITYKMRIAGTHWVRNSLAVLAAVDAVGADIGLSALALGEFQLPCGRGRRHHVTTRNGQFTVIDETHNASPAAVRAAFEVLGSIEPADHGRRIAVLGDMLELGPSADELHAALAKDISTHEVQHVFTCGPHMRHLREAIPVCKRAGTHVDTSSDLVSQILSFVRPGDTILVKGSFGVAMRCVVDELLKCHQIRC